MLTYIKIEIDKWFLFTFYKKFKLLFRAVSVKSLVWQVQNRKKCVFHHDDFVYLEMLKFLMIFYWFCVHSPALVLE